MPASDSRAAVAKPCKAAANERKGDMVGLRIARSNGRIGVVEIVGELSGDLKILIVAISAEPLIALLHVFLAQPFLVERLILQALRFVRDRHPKVPFKTSG